MHAKKLLIALAGMILFSFIQISFAAPQLAVDGLYEHGFYVGGMMGYVEPHNDNIRYFNSDNFLVPSFSSKIGTRFFVGYSYNDFYSAELGYNWLVHTSSGSSQFHLAGFDILGKFVIPVNIYFSAFAKAGFSYMNQDYKNVNAAGTITYRKDNSRVLLNIAGGGSFHVTSRFELQALITHMFGRSGIDSIDIFGIGAQYTF